MWCMCRGFGFVKFEDPTAVDRVMQANEHMLDGKAVGAPGHVTVT